MCSPAHTNLLAAAGPLICGCLFFTHPCTQALASAPVRAPRVPVYSNVTAQPFPSDPDAIRELLARQLTEPVQVRERSLVCM
jgi:malonyl CoA-acyl carrier protein transacylase